MTHKYKLVIDECLDEKTHTFTRTLAPQFGLAIVTRSDVECGDHFLCMTASGLTLQRKGENALVHVDFTQGKNEHRRRFGGGQGQDIAKAVGVSAYKPSVLDATAGLGRDSFVLASLGCHVTSVERHPAIAALLFDGLTRACNEMSHSALANASEIARIVARIRFEFASSHELMREQCGLNKWDVVYLDPMFPHDKRAKAQVKKDMQAFRCLVGDDSDADDLLDAARQAARCRVVVKRARKAPVLNGCEPSYQLLGKSNRFDVYVNAKVAPATK